MTSKTGARPFLDGAMRGRPAGPALRRSAAGRRSARLLARTLGLTGALLMFATGLRAEQPYPFEGTWVRADRMCSPSAPSARTYTSRDLALPNGHCALRRVAFVSGEWEIFEECRRGERQGSLTEKIRMLGPDSMLVKQQVVRLKIPRGHRFTRCTLAGPQKPAAGPPARSGPAHAVPAPASHPVPAPPPAKP